MQLMVFNLFTLKSNTQMKSIPFLMAPMFMLKEVRLMHMLRRWLGDADFTKGLHAYFEKHQYSNTIGRDLWDALGQRLDVMSQPSWILVGTTWLSSSHCQS